ncbi:hypothetical protein CHLRE_01g065092v5 [Chlamydomonas reinhardtii]|uniref:Uncharacterized protein n=1 Tax=Chlamydomonas reinhardtii TaxID=3055 RepID=A0A2K3E8G7_CHLRE|nr:uncharacterized protein CHLRE_01g065092v5 [Chlamydomonas reinhardtii]PNW89080.1 hypothetical protein CHLRE_01g065092v5 [Chlamydomonas reinhardtii]
MAKQRELEGLTAACERQRQEYTEKEELIAAMEEYVTQKQTSGMALLRQLQTDTSSAEQQLQQLRGQVAAEAQRHREAQEQRQRQCEKPRNLMEQLPLPQQKPYRPPLFSRFLYPEDLEEM